MLTSAMCIDLQGLFRLTPLRKCHYWKTCQKEWGRIVLQKHHHSRTSLWWSGGSDGGNTLENIHLDLSFSFNKSVESIKSFF